MFSLKILICSAFCFALVSAIDYDVSSSKIYDQYCLITHCSQSQIINWDCKLCSKTPALSKTQFLVNNVTNIMVYIGYSLQLDCLVAIFRGTVDFKNWIQDFSFNQVDYPRCKNCKIHEGFYLAYLSIQLQLSHAIESLLISYPSKKILVLGSSLGGALASIAALDLQSKYIIEELHTFGCPRFGNRDLAMYQKMKLRSVVRVVHNRDIVPHLPLTQQNYYHSPYEVFFDESMQQYQICNQSGEDVACSNSFYPNFSVEDHVNYFIHLDPTAIC